MVTHVIRDPGSCQLIALPSRACVPSPHSLSWLLEVCHHICFPGCWVEGGPNKGMPLSIPGHSHLILIGQNLVTWPYLAAREAGKCNLLAEQHYIGAVLHRRMVRWILRHTVTDFSPTHDLLSCPYPESTQPMGNGLFRRPSGGSAESQPVSRPKEVVLKE